MLGVMGNIRAMFLKLAGEVGKLNSTNQLFFG